MGQTLVFASQIRWKINRSMGNGARALPVQVTLSQVDRSSPLPGGCSWHKMKKLQAGPLRYLMFNYQRC